MIALFLIISLGQPSPVFGRETVVWVQGRNLGAYKLAAQKVELVWKVVSAKHEHESAGFLGGVPGKLKSRISYMLLRSPVGFKPLPRSAYSDWSDVTSISLAVSKGLPVEMRILGGDAGESFEVKLLFKNGELVERRVYSAEDPKTLYEKTFYSG